TEAATEWRRAATENSPPQPPQGRTENSPCPRRRSGLHPRRPPLARSWKPTRSWTQRLSQPNGPKHARRVSGRPSMPVATSPAFQGPLPPDQSCLETPFRRPVLDPAASVLAQGRLFCSSKSSSATRLVRLRKEHSRAVHEPVSSRSN